MKRTFLVFTLLILSISIFAQSNSDTIQVKSAFGGGSKFYQNGKLLTMSELSSIMKSNEQAYNEFSKAKSTATWASIFGGIGGFMLGYPLGTAIGGGKPNWTMAGIGAGLAIFSIPISAKFTKQAKSAVDIFNEGQREKSIQEKTAFKIGLTESGIGLSMTF